MSEYLYFASFFRERGLDRRIL